ncbi:MAG TPA: hypothetical protein PLX84_05445 [Acidiphilium sp.]|nr:hypothetical protein [Acidiphilium sp.]
MRISLVLASASALVLSLAVAHATTPSSSPPTTNSHPSASSQGPGTNASAAGRSSASSSSTSTSQSWTSTPTTNSNNTTNMAAAAAGGVAANNHSLAISASLSNFANDYKTISNYHLATATTNGTVYGGPGVYASGPNNMNWKKGRGGKSASGPMVSMGASLNNVANGTGIVTAQVNAGVNALQQNTVSLSSVVSGSSSTSVFH